MMQEVGVQSASPVVTLDQLPRMLSRPDRLGRALQRLVASDVLRRFRAPARAGEPYGRTLLHRDDFGEVMLATWRGDEACAPHDHGASRGLVCVLSGSFRETLYRMQSGVFTTVSQRDHAAHGLIDVERDVIHAMEPRGPGVTLHVYAPAISCMRVFDCERHEALTVSDDCGAWIPRDVRMVNARSCMSALAR